MNGKRKMKDGECLSSCSISVTYTMTKAAYRIQHLIGVRVSGGRVVTEVQRHGGRDNWEFTSWPTSKKQTEAHLEWLETFEASKPIPSEVPLLTVLPSGDQVFKHRSFWGPFLLKTTTVNLSGACTRLLIKKAYLHPKAWLSKPLQVWH